MHLIFSPEKLITHGTIVCILYVKFMCFTYPAAILWKNTMNDGGTQQNNTRPLYDSYLLALFAWGSVIGDILMYPVIRKRLLMLGGVNMIRYWWKNVINERRNKNRKRTYTGSKVLYNYGVTPVQKVFQLPKHVNHALGEIYISLQL